MADPVVTYPFDPTGQASTNRVVGEEIIVLPPGDRLFHYTMPKLAPFFGKNLIVKLRDLNNNVIPLTEGVDYYLSHKFMDASLATMHAIYGSISFLKRDIAGVLIVDYSHLGGIWTIDSATLGEIMLDMLRNPRITTWEQVVERTVDFPVIDHVWNLDDMVGQKEILEMMEKFYLAYLASLDPSGGGGGTGPITDHIRNKNNPHETTAAQVGAFSKTEINTLLLGYLGVQATAADSSKLEGRSFAEVTTQILANKIAAALRADTAGLADRATTADDSSHFGGLSYEEFLQYMRNSAVSSADRLNGLLPSEVKADILSGKAADSGKLDGKTLPQIKAELQAATSDAQTLQGKSLDALMTDVKGTKVNAATTADTATRFGEFTYQEAKTDILAGQAADALKLGGKSLTEIKAELQAATGDAQTLQGKSLSGIMADVKTTKVNNATTADNATSFDGKTYQEAKTDILTGQSADSAKLGGKTLSVITEELQAAASDAKTLQGKSLTAIMADVKGTKVDSATNADNATELNNKTYAQVVADVLSGKAADAGKLDGKTYQQVLDAIVASGIDAAKLQGKSLTAIMEDVKATLVDRATTASNAEKLGGSTLADITALISTLVPARSLDSDRVYGLLFNELTQNLVTSDTYRENFTFAAAGYDFRTAEVLTTTGTTAQDPNYNYFRVGTLYDADTLTDTTGTQLKLTFFYQEEIITIDIDFSFNATTKEIQMVLASNNAIDTRLYVGKRYGVQYNRLGDPSNYAEIYVKYLKALTPKFTNVFQQVRNDFVIQFNKPDIWDHTFNALDVVDWEQPPVSQTTAQLRAETQAALDDTADAITALIQTPAA